jgi:acetyltransferase-like isoleucine patch superfamily enzyme
VLRRFVNSVYTKTRGIDQGLDEELSLAEIVRSVGRRGVERVRGALRGLPSSYLGRRVTIRNPGKLRLGVDTVIGSGVTIDALSKKGVSLGAHVTVDQGAILRGSGVIRNLGEGILIGPRTSIGAFNVILGQGGVRIGADCLLGPSVTVVSENHVYIEPDVPIREQGEVRAETVIGDDVWIGAGAVILGGARIGAGAVIAAGAVVRGEVAPREIVGGVPARRIGVRG